MDYDMKRESVTKKPHSRIMEWGFFYSNSLLALATNSVKTAVKDFR
jgi:hypothetical protein